ncbi:hypothetical protein BDV28DRAFT_131572 [Aspergillus coremiiformis]|uniref:Uncharacterized protein n=1 Tax=Aspergillus coremiiformis TaxID=138285 RepID=A0A5N6ZAH2_9EURO|nr:hypothetical protein BDV28DRAFT_131572 [Aspergillus coremiiformis]
MSLSSHTLRDTLNNISRSDNIYFGIYLHLFSLPGMIASIFLRSSPKISLVYLFSLLRQIYVDSGQATRLELSHRMNDSVLYSVDRR